MAARDFVFLFLRVGCEFLVNAALTSSSLSLPCVINARVGQPALSVDDDFLGNPVSPSFLVDWSSRDSGSVMVVVACGTSSIATMAVVKFKGICDVLP